MTIIRQAGTYTIATENGVLTCNGRRTSARPVTPVNAGGRTVCFLVDTQELGDNGKRNMVGLTADEMEMHRADARAFEAAQRETPRYRRMLLTAQLEQAHADYSRAIGAGRHPGTAVADAEAALAAFDAANPELVAELRAEAATRRAEARASAAARWAD